MNPRGGIEITACRDLLNSTWLTSEFVYGFGFGDKHEEDLRAISQNPHHPDQHELAARRPLSGLFEKSGVPLSRLRFGNRSGGGSPPPAMNVHFLNLRM
jgi:hypothetical protein